MVIFKHLFLIYLFIYFFSASIGVNAKLIAQTDRNTIQAGELFQLQLSADNIVDFNEIDFSQLEKKFIIHEINGPSQVSQTINGRRTAFSNINIILSSNSLGTITIPRLSIGNQQSNSLTIEVKKADFDYQKDRLIYMKSTLSHNRAYIDQPIMLTLQLFNAMPLDKIRLTGLPENTEQLKAGTTEQKTINNIQYTIQTLFYRFTPQQAGKVDLDNIRINGLFIRNNRYASFEVNSPLLSLDVLPIPEEYPKDTPWLPADNVVLNDNLDSNNKLDAKTPLTREITVELHGLDDSYFKKLNIENNEYIEFYADKQQRNTLIDKDRPIGIINNLLAMIPQKNGEVTLPEISITWWNVNTQQVQISTIEAKTMSISGVKQFAQIDTAPTTAPVAESKQTDNLSRNTENSLSDSIQSTFILLVSSLVMNVVLAIALVGLLLSHKHSFASASVRNVSKKQTSVSKQAMLSACEQQQASQLKTATNEFFQSLANLDFDVKQTLKPLQEQMKQLDKYLYDKNTNDCFDYKHCAQTIEQLKLIKKSKQSASALRLYPEL